MSGQFWFRHLHVCEKIIKAQQTKTQSIIRLHSLLGLYALMAHREKDIIG